MKPFITNKFRDGRYFLEYQVENFTSSSLPSGVLGASIVASSIPHGHSYSAAWILRLVFDNGLRIDFSSATTDVGGWREVGSLNFSVTDEADAQRIDSLDLESRNISDFELARIEKLVYEEPDLYIENGIVFTSVNEQEILIAAGPAPGSVSVRALWTVNEFLPEFEIGRCKRIPF